jgi:VCBS repeat protein
MPVPARSPSSIASSVPVPMAVDQAASAGIAEVTRTWSAAIGDYNADGQVDILLDRHQMAARLYINSAGHFTEVDAGAFGNLDRHDCSAADVNGDGRLDFFCSAGAGRGTRAKANDLEIQTGSLTFTRSAPAAGLMDPFGRGRHSAFLDANGDGRPDLFIGNEGIRQDGLPSPDRLFINDGGGTFHPAPSFGLDHEIGSDCAVPGDVNNDGWIDLLLCSDTPTGIRLYRNTGGTGFTDVTSQMGIEGAVPASATLVDLNGDNKLDLVEVFKGKMIVLLQQAGTFQQAFTYPLTSGLAVASGDVNGDGVPDLYILQGAPKPPNDPDVMLLNDGDGTSFTKMSIPETSSGTGDTVYPIDFDGSGLTDFLVLNGKNPAIPGPVQLIAFYPNTTPKRSPV